MKEFIIFLPLAALYLAFKSTLFASVPMPDLPLIIVFYSAYRKTSIEGVILAFILGYMDDVMSGGIIGASSFSLIIVYMAVRLIALKVHFSTVATRAGGAASAALLKGVLIGMVLRSAGIHVSFLGNVLLITAATGVFAPAFITLFTRLINLVSPAAFKDSAH
ncbi:MAG: rod shape-determining protein MreD [Deltaproteobacteria bacterium]|nr:rod shape-determining protein MreD [Deltaproteobacteria bacterium]